MKTFAQFLNLMEDAPPGGAAPPPMGGPPMGGPPGASPVGNQAPMKLKSTNVWEVLERYFGGRQTDLDG